MLILLNTDLPTKTGFENGIDCKSQVKILWIKTTNITSIDNRGMQG